MQLASYISGAWKCHNCGKIEAINLPNPTTYTMSTPKCECRGYENGVRTFTVMSPLDDGARMIEQMNNDYYSSHNTGTSR